MELSAKDVKRFFMSFTKGKKDECWEWEKGRNRYGFFYARKSGWSKTLLAHRVAWVIEHDSSIPDGMLICHTCDNKLCVNPSHLYLGTWHDNNGDTVKRHPTGGNRKTGNDCSWTKIKDEQLQEIIDSSETQSVIAARYGVDQSVISRIKNGKRVRTALR